MEPFICYADRAVQSQVRVIENVRVARDTFRLRFECPDIARRILPGQFLMLRLADGDDPLLGRPLALYDTVLDSRGDPVGVDVVYLVVGKLTARLAAITRGQALSVWGPLGNGFPAANAEHLLMVAGGIGQTPFLAVAREALDQRAYGDPPRPSSQVQRVTLCYGARSGEYLAGVEDFRQLGVECLLSTDDGSVGQHGLVTDLVRVALAESAATIQAGKLLVVCCGPEKMMEAVAGLAAAAEAPCLASLETPMACGIGICFSCVARVRQPDGEWDYKRTCVEGPVFDASSLVW